jgi:hypothetical protein
MKSIETSWERRDLFLTSEPVMANMLLASTCQFPDHEGAIFSGWGIGESLRGMFDTSASRGGGIRPFVFCDCALITGKQEVIPGLNSASSPSQHSGDSAAAHVLEAGFGTTWQASAL